MKIIFLTAPNHGEYYPRRRDASMGLFGILPPLGLIYLAGVLEEKGHEVRILDLQVFDYGFNQIREITEQFNPSIIGFSFVTPQKDNILDFINYLRKYFKNCFFVAGGAHVSCFPEEFLKEAHTIDAVVVGEGEYIMAELADCLGGQRQIEAVKGIYFRKNGRIIKNIPANNIVELETLPFPARYLLPIKRYAPEIFELKAQPVTTMIVSRGCPYAGCTFCYQSGVLKQPYRCQSPAKTVDEIRMLIKDYGIREVIFYDDDLFSNFAWMNEFCDLLHLQKINILWAAKARANAVNYDLMRKAKENGCFAIEVGFESGNQHLLDKVKKGITLDECRRLSVFAHKADISVIGTFMLAIPGETPEDARRTIDFAIELDCSYAIFIPTHPFLGTELYEQCKKEGYFTGPAYDEKDLGARYMPKVSFVPYGYSGKEEVSNMVREAYSKFYFRGDCILGHLKSIKSFYDIRRYWYGLRFLTTLALYG